MTGSLGKSQRALGLLFVLVLSSIVVGISVSFSGSSLLPEAYASPRDLTISTAEVDGHYGELSLPDGFEPECGACEKDPQGNIITVVVDQSVTVNLNTNPPTYTGDPDLQPYFSYYKADANPAKWKAIFDVGAKKLLVKDGATITVVMADPTGGNNRRSPGIEIRACELEIENGGAVVVNSLNRQAGNILIHTVRYAVINGIVRNSVSGTGGFPGNITIASCYGDIITGEKSRIETIGQDPGGSDINLLTCIEGDIVINGLVDASYKGGVASTINIAAFNGNVTIDGNNLLGIEAGTQRRVTSGVTVRSRRDPLPGKINIQARGDITVYGNTVLEWRYPNIGAVGIKTASNSAVGGTITVVSLYGRIIASDRAFDDANRFNTNAKISLHANGNITLTATGRSNSVQTGDAKAMAVVSTQAGDTGKGGTNTLRSYSGGIFVGDGVDIGETAQVLANWIFRPGSNGANLLTSCSGVVVYTDGEVNPTDLIPADDSGVCDPSAPEPLFESCADFGVECAACIIIEKVSVGGAAAFNFTSISPVGGSTPLPSIFNITTSSGSDNSTTFGNLQPGIYNVTESGPDPPWNFTSLSCTSGGSPSGQTATITLAAGQTVKCTFTDEKPSGQPPCKWCTKGAVLTQVDQNIGSCCAVPDILVDLRYPKDDPIEQYELGSNIPATGSLQAAIDYVNRPDWPKLDPTPLNETFIGVTAQDCGTGTTGDTCGNQTGRGPYGDGTENVVITNVHQTRLNVFGCSIDLFAANASKPVVTIANSTGKVTVLDIHVWGSHVAGYLIENNDDLVVVKNSRSFGASGIGYWIKDDDVEITGSPEISGHDIGILVEGNNVKLRTNKDIVNNGIGIKITGDNDESNADEVGDDGTPNGIGILVEGKGNLLHGDNVIYNTGDGIVIAGSGTSLADGNFVTDEDAQHNGGNGIVVSGNYNTLDRNRQVKFNTGEGIKVTGANNYLNENDAEENGQNGIRASSEDGASNNGLKGNGAKNNPLQGIRACGQNDLGGNDGEGNGVDPQVDFLCAYPDLTITKTDSPDPVAGGANLTYTLTVGNSATATADTSGVKVVDTLPSGATFVSASGDHGFTCNEVDGAVTCTGGSIAIGESATITVIAKFGASFCGDTVTNTAKVDPDGGIMELNEDNNGVTATTKVNCADLTISKNAPKTVESGAELTYTLTVGNAGAADASGVRVLDTLPSGATYVPGSASGTNGFSCSEAGGIVTCTGGSIAIGGSATITIKVTFGAGSCSDTVKNTAVVDPDNTIAESDNNNNDADVQTKVICGDLDVTIKDDTPSNEDLNSFGGYTSKIQYELTNDDDADIGSVTFNGTFTGTATRANASRVFSGDSAGWTCTFNDANSWSCTGPLAAGDTVDITLSVTGPSGQAGKTVTYTVTPPVCTGPGPCADGADSPANSDGGDVTPDQDTDNLVEPLFIDLTISKEDSPDPVKAGNNLTYTLTVGNAGNKNATGVKVVDTLASGVSFVSVSGPAFSVCSYDTGTRKVTCTGGTINAGQSATITIKVTFGAASCGSSKTNTAVVDPDGTIAESDNNNNDATTTTSVVCADLDVTINASSPSGQELKVSDGTGYTSKIQYKLKNSDDDAGIGSVTFNGTFTGTATRANASRVFSGDSAGWTCTFNDANSWSCSGPLADGDEVLITFTVTGPTQAKNNTIIYTVTPAPVCKDPGPCTDGADSPANSDGGDVTPGPDTDTLT